jgi:hypothetical protein
MPIERKAAITADAAIQAFGFDRRPIPVRAELCFDFIACAESGDKLRHAPLVVELRGVSDTSPFPER